MDILLKNKESSGQTFKFNMKGGCGCAENQTGGCGCTENQTGGCGPDCKCGSDCKCHHEAGKTSNTQLGGSCCGKNDNITNNLINKYNCGCGFNNCFCGISCKCGTVCKCLKTGSKNQKGGCGCSQNSDIKIIQEGGKYSFKEY